MARVVEGPNVPLDTGRGERRADLARVPDAINAEAALGMAEDKLVVAPERGAWVVTGERVDERRRERDRPLALLALGLGDSQHTLDEVDVAPAQAEQLSSPPRPL